MKECKHCKLTLPISEFYFYKKKNYTDGACKTCRQKAYRNWKYDKHPTTYSERKKDIETGQIVCLNCQIKKPLSAFENGPSTKKKFTLGYNYTCRECRNIVSFNCKLKKHYGITLYEYNKMRENQNNKCAICKTSLGYKDKSCCIDHCHQTGNIRGLLCNRCNRCLGLLKDNVEILYSAIRYLKNSIDLYKSDELLEKLEAVNQQPSQLGITERFND